MISEEQLLSWNDELDAGRIQWHGEMRELIAEVRRYHLLKQQFEEYQKSFDNTVQNLVETRIERNNLKESLKREVEHLTISINERVKLEKEADWLANRATGCPPKRRKENTCPLLECKDCWREAARKAIQND